MPLGFSHLDGISHFSKWNCIFEVQPGPALLPQWSQWLLRAPRPLEGTQAPSQTALSLNYFACFSECLVYSKRGIKCMIVASVLWIFHCLSMAKQGSQNLSCLESPDDSFSQYSLPNVKYQWLILWLHKDQQRQTTNAALSNFFLFF